MLVVKGLKTLKKTYLVWEKSLLKQSVLGGFNSSSIFSSYVATVNLMLYVELNVYRFLEMLTSSYL